MELEKYFNNWDTITNDEVTHVKSVILDVLNVPVDQRLELPATIVINDHKYTFGFNEDIARVNNNDLTWIGQPSEPKPDLVYRQWIIDVILPPIIHKEISYHPVIIVEVSQYGYWNVCYYLVDFDGNKIVNVNNKCNILAFDTEWTSVWYQDNKLYAFEDPGGDCGFRIIYLNSRSSIMNKIPYRPYYRMNFRGEKILCDDVQRHFANLCMLVHPFHS
jgi:hypothetical protein